MALRPGYKETEVGVIPEDWKVERLGGLAEFVTSGSRGWARFYTKSGALFIRSQNVRDGRLNFEDVQYVSPPTGAEGNRTKVVLNDLLITITGNSVGNVAMVDRAFDEAYISQHVGLVRLRDPAAAGYICRYLAPNSPGNPQIAGSQSGQSKPGLNLQNLRDFLIAVPPTAKELHAIEEVLRDVDALLSGLDGLIAKTRDLKQAAMQQLLTGQTRLSGFSGEWKFVRLGDHVTFLRNGVNSRAELLPEGSVRYLHYGDIHASGATHLAARDLPFLPSTKASRLDRLRDGDLILADASEDLEGVSKSVEMRDIGDSVEVVSGLHTIAARFDKATLADGFKGFLQYIPMFAAHLRRLAAGTKVYATNRAHVASAEIPLPSTNEQRAIAKVLSDMDAELAALEARRDKTRNLKQAMMQELLTGKTRLVPTGGARV
ncbi:restriction endonuclease subunit S domain-containing protein [Pyxidicoccus xibeiensis]|uniref:hypothetical protein n=1 Tax=Pyxidicoccus xibeiensis TaxID=2906759 RepID=UPI0020A7DE20|nr:hypothetical protein [Pyxidicoccus xibeiensis]MCP3139330.1 hypothetical protein [Pyxidicoccus xibeiensis]